MNTVEAFNQYYKEHVNTLRLGQAFIRYFNVIDADLYEEQDDSVAQERINEYFRKWGCS